MRISAKYLQEWIAKNTDIGQVDLIFDTSEGLIIRVYWFCDGEEFRLDKLIPHEVLKSMDLIKPECDYLQVLLNGILRDLPEGGNTKKDD